MPFYPEILADEGSNVNDAEHVSLSGLNGRSQVLRIVHQVGIGNWFGSSWVGDTDKSFHEIWDLIVVPIG